MHDPFHTIAAIRIPEDLFQGLIAVIVNPLKGHPASMPWYR